MNKALNIFLSLILAFFIMACTKTQVVTKVEFIKQKIPNELLYVPTLKRIEAKNESDILLAYSNLFYAYKRLVLQIEKIKALEDNE